MTRPCRHTRTSKYGNVFWVNPEIQKQLNKKRISRLKGMYIKRLKQKLKGLERNNLLKEKDGVPNKSGVYSLYNKNEEPIYVGSSKMLRHRLQYHREKDDYNEHPTKEGLHKEAKFFQAVPMPINDARVIEKVIKKDMKYNYK